MNHYTYHQTLGSIWNRGVAAYRSGKTSPEGFLSTEDLDTIRSVGLKVMDIFDFVEDFCGRGEPDRETFLMVCEARRDYFLTVQKGTMSSREIDMETLPPKDEAVEGIEWLPRIIPKALAKLRGEMPSDLMYLCGGDRKFLKTHDIHPSEFLRVVWAYEEQPAKIVDWVKERSKAGQGQ